MINLTAGLDALCRADPAAAAIITKDRLPLIVHTLTHYIDEIERFNPAYGLVKTSGREELILRHILDSLAPLGHIARILYPPDVRHEAPPRSRLADAGSGAGLPGIPLGICLPEVEITLIERMGRRANFLRNTLAALALSHITVEETELERAPPGRFDAVVFRALRPLSPALVKNIRRLLKPGGTAAAWKGRRAAAETELAALGGENGGTSGGGKSGGTGTIIPIAVPFLEEERCLVLFQAAAV